jgi:hypothetical protein
MKTLVTCASIAAVSAIGVKAQGVTEPTPSKPWSLSAKVRGFYDDNYLTAPSGAAYAGSRLHSWGVDVNPGLALHWKQDTTTLIASYNFDMRWYEARPNHTADYSHNITLSLSHAFSERNSIDLFDTFVIAQEPSLLQGGTYYRVEGNNIRNYGGIAYNTRYSDKFGSRFQYSNTYYDYENSGAGSYSALLDRMEHLISADFRYLSSPTTTMLIGYQFGYVDQLSKDPLSVADPTVLPDVRNRISHYGFLGLDHQLTSQLSAMVRAGVQYTRYPNHDRYGITNMEKDNWAPYADAALQYAFAEGSKVQLGVKHGLIQTDLAGLVNAADLKYGSVLDSEATTVYGTITYRILPKLTGLVRGEWQGGSFSGGGPAYNGKWENYFTADVNLSYAINQYLSAEIGYAFDRLDSDFSYRSFTRNRGYAGIDAKY